MEYDEKKGDLDAKRTAEIMRDDYASLYNKLNGNQEVKLTKSDYAKLLVAAYIVSENINTQLQQLQSTYNNYKTLIIPKLGRINDETKTDEEAQQLAEEIFQITDNN
jgi:hypothetical protein